MSDLERRAKKLNETIEASGGPDALVANLARGLNRQARYLAATALSVALDIALSILLAVALSRTSTNAHKTQVAQAASDRNAAKIAALQHSQAVLTWNLCVRSATNTTKINTTTRAFIAFVDALPASPDPTTRAQTARFKAIYTKAILAVPQCGEKP